MKKRSEINSQPAPAIQHILLLALLAGLVSVASFYYCFERGEILLYGDAVAHINIARRVFDSRTPGLLQLGTVWLPLPHLLMVPFLLSKSMWQTGAGGSIPSMIAYVFGVVGIFRLVRGMLERHARTRDSAVAGAWIAALVYAANPNLIYIQATAMTEALYLAFFIWAAVYFSEFLQGLEADVNKSPSLLRCGLCLAGAQLTRYDGWFLAAALGLVVAGLALPRWSDRLFRRRALAFLAAISIAPTLWLVYNGASYGNALEFANGPYSAKAIERRSSVPGSPPHPGTANLAVSASYILKSGELIMADGNWGRTWVAIAVAGLALTLRRLSANGVALLLWIPLVFYALSIAYGGVPIFLPTWWPYTWYNMRYGLQLLPLFAASAGLLAAFGAGLFNPPPSDRSPGTSEKKPEPKPNADSINLRPLLVCVAAILVVGFSYASVWKAQPLCFKEAWVNSRTKLALESAVARTLRNFPRDATYLMYLGDHVGAFQEAGIPLKQVVNEANHRPWKKPSDPDGLWEKALADPSRYVDIVIAYEGDDVDKTVNKNRLTLIADIHTTGQPRAHIYATHLVMNPSR